MKKVIECMRWSIVSVGIGLFLYGSFYSVPTVNKYPEEKKDNTEYSRGVNEALESFTLLNLELEIKNERKSFGQMNEIVCKRLSVVPDKSIVKP